MTSRLMSRLRRRDWFGLTCAVIAAALVTIAGIYPGTVTAVLIAATGVAMFLAGQARRIRLLELKALELDAKIMALNHYAEYQNREVDAALARAADAAAQSQAGALRTAGYRVADGAPDGK